MSVGKMRRDSAISRDMAGLDPVTMKIPGRAAFREMDVADRSRMGNACGLAGQITATASTISPGTGTQHGKNPSGRAEKSERMGLYDMCGNVWERTQGWYGRYEVSGARNPSGPQWEATMSSGRKLEE